MLLSALQSEVYNLLLAEYRKFSLYKKFKFFFNKSQTTGFYLYGSVGSGKTTIIRNFYDNCGVVTKQFIHYQELLKIFYQKTENFADKANYFTLFAQNYFKNLDVLCIDEVEIKDSVNAVIILQLLSILIKNNTFVVSSSNFHPHDFSSNVIGSYAVESLINFYTHQFLIVELHSQQDYRLLSMNDEQRIIFPKNAINIKKFDTVVTNLIDNRKSHVKEIVNFGRKITFIQTYQELLITNFQELFGQEFSYTDYISICQHFKQIVIKDIPLISQDDHDQIIRFINFIDNAYINNIILFALFIDNPLIIYAHLTQMHQFKRTVSRIIEMSSSKYFYSARNSAARKFHY